MQSTQQRALRHMPAAWESAEERVLRLAADAPRSVVAVSRHITRMGDRSPVWAAVGAAATARSVHQHRVDPLAAALGTLAVGAAARAGMARWLNRARPPERWWRMQWSGPSFPSRHTTLASLGAGLVAGCLTPTQPRIARFVRWGPSIGVGISRVVLGVHWPTDVAAGWLFATGVLATSRRVRAAAGVANRAQPDAAHGD